MRNSYYQASLGINPIGRWWCFTAQLTAVLLCILSTARANGQRENFLSQGPGSASRALGDALVSKGIDSSAGFYNPATLIYQPSGALLEYAQPNIGASRAWLAVASGRGPVKVGLLWKNETLPLSSNKNAFLMSAGLSDRLFPYLPKDFSLGLTLGYVTEKIVTYSASSFMASLGAAYARNSGIFKWGLGAMLSDLYFSGLQFRPDGDKEIYPVDPRLGGYVSKWGITLLGSLSSGDGTRTAFGIAYQPIKYLELRAGINDLPRIGLGLEVRKFRLDFAMTMGELQNSNSFTFSYLWGKEETPKDYTNPLEELSAKYAALPDSLLSELKRKVQNQEVPELHDVLRLLSVDMNSQDGWSFYQSLTGEKRFPVKLPLRKKHREEYLEFAVAFANDSSQARELARNFLARGYTESVNKLIQVILEKDLVK